MEAGILTWPRKNRPTVAVTIGRWLAVSLSYCF